MALETATYISDLVITNPPGTDQVSQGDDHIRLIKSVLQNTFSGMTGAATTFFLPLTGGTLTGGLTLSGPLPQATINGAAGTFRSLNYTSGGSIRWQLMTEATAEASGNVGSNFLIRRLDNTGAFIDTPLSINRATGLVTLTDGMTVSSGLPFVVLDSPTPALRQFIGNTAGLNRWSILVGDSAAEGGSNGGSDFRINRYPDSGASAIDSPLVINRASGQANFAQPVTIASDARVVGASGTYRQFSLYSGTTSAAAGLRFSLNADATAEGAGNAGSNFGFNAYDNTGVFIASIFSVVRSTQVVSFAKAIVNGPSDRRLKENIQPLDGALNKVQQLKGVSFNFIKDKAKRHIGLIAQDVAPIVPEVMQDFQDFDAEGKETTPKLAIDYTRLVPVLIEAIKELTARVATLEAKGV